MSKNIRIISSIIEMNEFSNDLKSGNKKVAYVPTMGALHEGHLSLVDRANQIADHTIVSIFVNPTQFGHNEDFGKYTRDLEGDTQKLSSFNVAAVFLPDSKDIYPESFQTYIEVTDIQKDLCGKSRPGHFRGVATVVVKLFNIVQPDYAVFGQKDFQQLKVIERLVKDLHLSIEIIPMPIVREEDGLALSSRNAYLSDEERVKALGLSKALSIISQRYREGCKDSGILVEEGKNVLKSCGVNDIDYLEIRGSNNLELIKTAESGNLVAVAANIGSTRLIDNIIL